MYLIIIKGCLKRLVSKIIDHRPYKTIFQVWRWTLHGSKLFRHTDADQQDDHQIQNQLTLLVRYWLCKQCWQLLHTLRTLNDTLRSLRRQCNKGRRLLVVFRQQQQQLAAWAYRGALSTAANHTFIEQPVKLSSTCLSQVKRQHNDEVCRFSGCRFIGYFYSNVSSASQQGTFVDASRQIRQTSIGEVGRHSGTAE